MAIEPIITSNDPTPNFPSPQIPRSPLSFLNHIIEHSVDRPSSSESSSSASSPYLSKSNGFAAAVAEYGDIGQSDNNNNNNDEEESLSSSSVQHLNNKRLIYKELNINLNTQKLYSLRPRSPSISKRDGHSAR